MNSLIEEDSWGLVNRWEVCLEVERFAAGLEPDIHYSIKRIIADGDLIAVHGHTIINIGCTV